MIDNSDIIKRLNNGELVKINNFLNIKDFNNLKNKVTNIINEKGKKYFRLNDNELDKYNLRDIFLRNNIDSLSSDILLDNEIDNSKKVDTHTVLRVLSGKNNKKGANEYHFDSFLITLMLPIIIRQKKLNTGKFLIIPNIRKIQKFFIFSLIQKIILQNRLIRKILTLSITKRILKATEVNLEENSLYIFYGYKSFHGSSSLVNDTTRVTFLHHVYRPHNESKINKLIFKRRNIKEKHRSDDNK